MIPQDFIVVTKMEAAERQLTQAILMFFNKQDAVSIHTLAASSYQIITDICNKQGVIRELEDSEHLEQWGIKKQVLDAVKRPQNFFKHADKDGDDTIKLNPSLSACLMMSSVQYLIELKRPRTPEYLTFQTWFYLKFPSDLNKEAREIISSKATNINADDYSLFLESMHNQRNLET